MAFATIHELREKYLLGEAAPLDVLNECLGRANSNLHANVYLAQDAEWSRREAAGLGRDELEQKPLWGVPVSLKDCFDLAAFATSAGSLFYREQNGVAAEDSAVAARLRTAGAVITGKTHLHQLAYGITGENPDFGDCLQPRDAALLTGGSSSGAAASVQEGSAMAAIGTDTGGSIRVPAALCGLAGFRGSLTRSHALARGCTPLASSFDTFGWLYRDLRDGPLLAQALFGIAPVAAPELSAVRVGVPCPEFLRDCEADVLAGLRAQQADLRERGATVVEFDAGFFDEAFPIFAPLQASEAARYHMDYAGGFAPFEPSIAERLAWGLSLSGDEIADLRARHESFNARLFGLFQRFDFLLLPATPASKLLAKADHSQTRARILRYTAPFSLGGLPAVTLPGTCLQMVAPLDGDAELLALSTLLG